MKSSRHLPGVAVGDKVSGLGPGEVARILDRTGIGPAGTGHVEGVDRIRDPVGHKGVPGHIEVDRSLVDPADQMLASICILDTNTRRVSGS